MTELFPLVEWQDAALRTPVDKFDFAKPPFDPETFSNRLIETMKTKGGMGLAAPQVGISLAAFAIWSAPPQVIFNPIIVDVSEEKVSLEEACLSFPGIVLNIKRPAQVRMRFTNVKGETLTRKFEGLTARVLQHEMEHLEGKSFVSNVSRVKLDTAMKKAKKQGFEYVGLHKWR